MKPVINFIFNTGHRCYSQDFLKKFELRKMSSPFDNLIIDFETTLKIINNKFVDFLDDIVLINNTTKHLELFYKKNTSEIDKRFNELLENDTIGYMSYNYNPFYIRINQNYLDVKLTDNFYNWNTICCFIHPNILDENIYNSIKNRFERFNTIMNKYNETTTLFHITRINNCENITNYTNNIIELKKRYNINCFLIIIINCDNIEDSHYYNETEKCLFIIKNVENYETQYTKYDLDNEVKHLNYEKEFNVILNHFTLNLIEKTELMLS